MLTFVMLVYWKAVPILEQEFATRSECEVASIELLHKQALAPELLGLPDIDYGVTTECRAVQHI